MTTTEIQLECAIEHLRNTMPVTPDMVWDYEIDENDGGYSQAIIRIWKYKWSFAINYYNNISPSGEIYWFINDGHGVGNNYVICFDWSDPKCLDIIVDNFETALGVLHMCKSRSSKSLHDFGGASTP